MLSESLIPKDFPTEQPMRMFREMFAHGLQHRLWIKLKHQRFSLLELAELLKDHPVRASHYAGIQTVNINHIQGTQSKTSEFDADFNPMQERSRARWIYIALEKLRGHELPPVALIRIGDIYFVRDGHHRISVSRAMGQIYIDAEVTVMQLRGQNLIR